MNMKDIQFVSYDGKYPNLCSGNLELLIDGKKHIFDHILISGGCAGVDLKTYEEYCEEGDWSISFWDNNGKATITNLKDEEIVLTDEELNYLTRLVNENVPCGCCGGCI